MYPAGGSAIIDVERFSSVLEGRFRSGHFRGVATIVTKLLNVVSPDVGYFGQKDFQQQVLIRCLCRELLVPVEIRTCPIVRDADGLALSSRNAYLSPQDRIAALAIPQSLSLTHGLLKRGESIAVAAKAMHDHLRAMPDLHVDYATIADPENLDELTATQANMVALVAAHVRETRLIDNMLIQL